VASRLNPYISFKDNARQAMEFYQGVFGGNLVVNTFGDLGAPVESSDASKVMHSMLETDSGFTIMAADTPEHMPQSTPGNNIAVSLSGDDAADLRRYWDKLSENGTVAVPMEKQAWGDEFGMCIDQFGISWMVNVTQPQV
jgi:PhnB protein